MRRTIRALVGAGCGLAMLGLASPAAASPAAAPSQRGGLIEHWGAYFGDDRPADEDMIPYPAQVTLPGQVAEVGTSNSTQYALLTNGSLYAWGQGTNGQLGDGSSENSFTSAVRVRFPAGVKIASIPADAMPYDTGLAVDTTGRAWGWGLNEGGELCLGSKQPHSTPVELPFSGVTTLAGANQHASYDSGGTVYSCGQNIDGALGTGNMRSSYVRVPVRGLSGSPVTELVASFANTGALLADGEYLDWGYDGAGQLGNGTVNQSSDLPVQVSLPFPVTQVAQGGSLWSNGQTLVMLSGGSVWAWGNGRDYQLGTGTRAMQPSPVPIRSPAGVTYQTLATGGQASYAVSTAGDVYAWGSSSRGQLGDGSSQAARHPVQVESAATGISSTANDVVVGTGQ